MVEQQTFNLRVVGSIPTGFTGQGFSRPKLIQKQLNTSPGRR